MKDPKEETTYGLSPDRLAKLLALGLQGERDEEDVQEEQTAAEVLQDMLSAKLPPEEVLDADKTVGNLLLDSKTDLSVIKTLKDYGKELVRREGLEAEEAAATAVYYATIASALVFHREKITQHPYEQLKEALTDLEEKPWISSELKDLFGRASAVCSRQMEEQA